MLNKIGPAVLIVLFFICSVAHTQTLKFRKGVFLHHSTGGIIWNGDTTHVSIPLEIHRYNVQHAFSGADSMRVTAPSWPRVPYNNNNEWYIWDSLFTNGQALGNNLDSVMNVNPIVILKTCFTPISYLEMGTGGFEGIPADTLTWTRRHTVTYRWHVRRIVHEMSRHPENFFALWNGAPPAHGCGTVPRDSNAHTMLRFVQWMKDTLATGNDDLYTARYGAFPPNVYIFDYYRKVAGDDGYEQDAYAMHTGYPSSGDCNSHPNTAAAVFVGPQFVQEIFEAALTYETAGSSLAVPIQQLPATGSTGHPNLLLLKWGRVKNAIRYHLQVATDSAFHSLVVNDSTLSDTLSHVGPLAVSTDYFWRVRAANINKVSSWSDAWQFQTGPYTFQMFFTRGWNLISIPLSGFLPRTGDLFPDARSSAITYTSAYIIHDSLMSGVGYWLKYTDPIPSGITGVPLLSDTIELHKGWNMIGSIADPVPTASILSNPPDLVTSLFFRYDRSYIPSDTITPGWGYWVKAGEPGSIILSNGSHINVTKSSRQLFDQEVPPDPPQER